MIDNILKSDFCVFASPEFFVLALEDNEVAVSFRNLVKWAINHASDKSRKTVARKHAELILAPVADAVSAKTLKAATKDVAEFCTALMAKHA